ncbi:MAG: hypothetical protein LBI12_04865 [Treponema sp.]|jgi:hypothetical protein|nr:hypothetical protein [Treponema sp.]
MIIKVFIKDGVAANNKLLPPPLRPFGHLLECFVDFHFFKNDYPVLVENGFIRPISPESCEWLKSTTSLAEYFKWIAQYRRSRITGGFWFHISEVFNVNRNSLRKLAGDNGNGCKPPKSKDFLKLKELLYPAHQETLRYRRETELLNAIEKILHEAKGKKPEIIHEAVERIDELMIENNYQKSQEQSILDCE